MKHTILLKRVAALWLLLWGTSMSLAQVAINNDGASPDASAMLDVTSTDKGILIPRMTAAQRDAISNPANGLLVYVTDDNQFYYYTGTEWQPFGKNDGDWIRDGNDLYSAPDSTMVIKNGKVGIGTIDPFTKLDIQIKDSNLGLNLTNNETGSSSRYPGINVTNYKGTTTGHPYIALNNAGGSKDSPTAMDSMRTVGAYIFRGYDGTKFVESGRIRVASRDYFAENYIPGRMEFWVNDGTSIFPKNRMVIDYNGYVGIGTQDPSTNLDVVIQNSNYGIQLTNTLTSNDSDPKYPGLKITNYKGGSIGYPHVTLLNAKGNESGPQAMDSLKLVGAFAAGGYDGTKFVEVGRIRFTARDDFSEDYAPGLIEFLVNDGTGVYSKRSMLINYDGNVGIGTGDMPESRLTILENRDEKGAALLSTYELTTDTEQTIYGGRFIAQLNTDSNLDRAVVRGLAANALPKPSAGNQVGYAIAVNGYVDNLGAGNVYMGTGTAGFVKSSGGGGISYGYGLYSQVQNTTVRGIGVFVQMYNNTGTTYGIFTQGEDKNHLEGALGIGTTYPQEKLHVAFDNDTDITLGVGTADPDVTFITLRSPNGTKWYIYVDDSGNLVTTTTHP